MPEHKKDTNGNYQRRGTRDPLLLREGFLRRMRNLKDMRSLKDNPNVIPRHEGSTVVWEGFLLRLTTPNVIPRHEGSVVV